VSRRVPATKGKLIRALRDRLLTPQIRTDNPEVRPFVQRIANEAGCHEGCTLIAGWSIRDMSFVLWHGLAETRCEIQWDGVGSGLEYAPGGDREIDRLVVWVRKVHEAQRAFEDA
jgi:hypothetical protein